MCPYIAYPVTELENVFQDLIFWRFLFIPPIAPNIDTRQIYFFTVMTLRLCRDSVRGFMRAQSFAAFFFINFEKDLFQGYQSARAD